MQLFISDLHLHESRPETSQLFFSFIAGPAQNANRLFILGDLFEYWAGDDDIPVSLHSKVCAALKSLATRGVDIGLIVGNRDFLLNGGFCAASGAVLLPDPTTEIVAGIPTVLLHGDTLCTDDVEYQQFRQQVRSPSFIEDFLRRPLAERKATIEKMRGHSESEKQVKSASLMDVNEDTVIAAFRSANVTRMIHGHTHRLATHHYDINGKPCERWVLGDWGTKGNYLEGSSAGWRFCSWNGNNATTLKS